MVAPQYKIIRLDQDAALTRAQLEETLARIPISINILSSYDLSQDYASALANERLEEPVLAVNHGAQLIVLRPEPGKRLFNASFGKDRSMFEPLSVMDESTGGICSRYGFNTERLGLPYSVDLMLDIHKFGFLPINPQQ